MRPCYLSGRFEWGDGGIAGEAAVQDLNVPVRQWIVPRRGLDRSCCRNYSTLDAFFQGEFNDIEGLAGNRRHLRTELRAASAGHGLPVRGPPGPHPRAARNPEGFF